MREVTMTIRMRKLIINVGTPVLVVIALGLGYWIRGAPPEPEVHAYGAGEEQEKEAEVWTCSMHPQVEAQKKGKCPYCGMDLIPRKAGDDEEGERALAMSEAAKALAEIQTSRVERRFVEAEIRVVGKVEYDETRLAYITAWVAGRLDRLYVDYTGVPVKKGEHLVYLYSPELYSAQEELLQALRAVKELENSGLDSVRDTALATVEAARERLRLWGLTAAQVAETEQRGKASDHMTIYAPVGGIVVHKSGFEGMYVKTGTRIYTIADLTRLWVKLDAYESDLSWIRYGQEVEFETEAYPGEQFVGSVAFIDPMLDARTRTVKVRLNVGNSDGRLKPGMFVRAVLRSKLAYDGRVMDPHLAGKWICSMHPDMIKDEAGQCDQCEMPLVRTETLGFDPAGEKGEPPLVVPASAPLMTGARAVVYVRLPASRRFPPTALRSAAGLVEKLREARDPLSAHLQESMGLSALLEKYGDSGLDSKEFKKKLAKALEETLAAPGLYTKERFAETALSAEAQRLIRLDPRAEDLMRLNRLLLEEAYPDEIEKSPPIFAGREIELGPRAGNYYLVRSGLLEGERVVTKGNFKIDSELQIKARPSMMSMPGGPMKPAPAIPAERYEAPAAFRDQFADATKAYFSLWQALAADEPGTAAAKAMSDALARVDMKLLTGRAHMAWMKESKRLQQAASELAGAKDLEGQRRAFGPLSDSMVTVFKTFEGLAATPLVQFHCPMVFDNRGAMWLQDSDEILNPYFGEMMLKCGEKTGEIGGKAAPAKEEEPLKPIGAEDVPAKFREQLAAILRGYLTLWRALAADDAKAAAAAGKLLEDSLTAVDMKLLKGEAHLVWMKEQASLKKTIAQLKQARDLTTQREAFGLLSESLPVVLETFGHAAKKPITRFKCSMAFNNRGATWLQDSDDLLNPYFGAAMLKCGEKVGRVGEE